MYWLRRLAIYIAFQHQFAPAARPISCNASNPLEMSIPK